MRYKSPHRDMQFVLYELLDIEAALCTLPDYRTWDRAVIDATVEALAKFSAQELEPLNASGDVQGCRLESSGVKTPEGYAAAYTRFVAAGWPSLACVESYGGQGAPLVVLNAATEALWATNPAWSMFYATAKGAYACLLAHATPALNERYLSQIVSGAWTATMCLTEAHSGSDLSLLRTRALAQADGSYRVTGEKIFISGGDHDMADNIVHLVLARLPDSPPGIHGISLFLVPKFLPEGDALSATINGVSATAVEHKMGLRGSATCAMSFNEAQGWLVGRANEGLRNMFVMMNATRISVGVQAVGMGQMAYARSLQYARERLQMRVAGGAKRPDLAADPIIEHADVRRMLLTQKATVEAARMLVAWLSLAVDRANSPDAGVRELASATVNLLTPVAKAFLSENAHVATQLAIQIFGGHGYVRDSGVEQIARDIRVAQIYEGTNGIQARDLLARKVIADGGKALATLLSEIRTFAWGLAEEPVLASYGIDLLSLTGQLEQLTQALTQAAQEQAEAVGAAAWDYLRVLGHLVCGYLFAQAAAVSQRAIRAGSSDPYYPAKLATALFYQQRLMPEAQYHVLAARSGLPSLSALSAEQLFSAA